MFHVVLPTIETLFAGNGQPRQAVRFDWRLIRRNKHPFLLLPTTMTNVRVGLELYSAQRRRAKIWREFLPLLFRTPAAVLFDRISFEADAGSEIMQFLARQAGVPAHRIQASAIKFGGVGQRARLVLLLCDETRRPVSVIKIGLNAAGRAATDQEADLLEKLPPGKLGCIRLTNRLNTPALSLFATAYFPGDSPADDAGMEHLFHDWLNPGPAVPLASLEVWREFATKVAATDPGNWQVINTALAGKTARTTLQHGDFAPWNIRAVNAQNLQVFDWERGCLQGIPGWDWFHFVVQTAILARRLSVERVAAEVEQLLQSDRFQKYAQAAGISDFVQPLLLAYLLHQRWVIVPREGGQQTAELYELLSARWQMTPPRPATAPATLPPDGMWAGAVRQLWSAAIQLSDLFWEPSLTANPAPTLRAQFSRHWLVVLLTGLLLAGLVTVQYFSPPHLMFLPFYVAACALPTWKIGRRWGLLAAVVAASAGPLIANAKQPGYLKPDVMMWNIVMRFLTLQLSILFVEQIHRQKQQRQLPLTPTCQSGKFIENWAVVLASGLLFGIVTWLDFITPPQMSFLPLYLVPCMILTLVLNLRWGMAAALVAAGAASLVQYATNLRFEVPTVFGWNFAMNLVVCLMVVLLLDRIRKENILLISRKTRQH